MKKYLNKKIFCLIPARSGSKRLKNKNIKKLKQLSLQKKVQFHIFVLVQTAKNI